MKKLSKILSVCLLASPLVLTACDESSSGTGRLNLNIADAPVHDASHVVVAFSGVSIKPENGSAYEINFIDDNDQPVIKTIDLLSLQGLNSERLLHDHILAAGRYNWLRLHVISSKDTVDSYIELNTGRHPLYVPSGDETGLKLNRPFDIVEGSDTSLTIDFDLGKSVVAPGQGTTYKLRPTLRMVNNAEMGHISGHVGDVARADASCTGADYAVYVFAGDNITPDDIDGNDPDPVTTSQLSNTYDYALGFLEPGSYTLAFTCQAAADDVDADDAINFVSGGTVMVTPGTNTQYDFN